MNTGLFACFVIPTGLMTGAAAIRPAFESEFIVSESPWDLKNSKPGMEVDLAGFVPEVGKDAEQVRNSEHGPFFLSPYLGVFVLLVNKR